MFSNTSTWGFCISKPAESLSLWTFIYSILLHWQDRFLKNLPIGFNPKPSPPWQAHQPPWKLFTPSDSPSGRQVIAGGEMLRLIMAHWQLYMMLHILDTDSYKYFESPVEIGCCELQLCRAARKRKFHIKMAKYALKTSTCEEEKNWRNKQAQLWRKIKKRNLWARWSIAAVVMSPPHESYGGHLSWVLSKILSRIMSRKWQ